MRDKSLLLCPSSFFPKEKKEWGKSVALLLPQTIQQTTLLPSTASPRISVALFIASVLVPSSEKQLNFLLLILFLTLSSSKNALRLLICTSYKWNCTEFIQGSDCIFAATGKYLERMLQFVRTECKSPYSSWHDVCLSELYLFKILLEFQFSCFLTVSGPISYWKEG